MEEFKRMILKVSDVADEVATIPSTNDHTDGSWLNTDIYEGELFLNLVDDIIQTRTDNGIVTFGNGTTINARNNSGDTIPKGTAVMATGTLGASGIITIGPIVADGSISGKYYIGIAENDINNDEDGVILTYGKLKKYDTSGFTEGAVLWLDPTVDGGLTETEPQAPNLKIATAFVVTQNANNGVLMIRANQGVELSEDSDVQLTSLTDGDVLTYDSADGRWENQQPADQTLIETIILSNSRALLLTDKNKNLENSADITITIPTNASVEFPIGTQIFFTKKAESLDFVASGGVTINSVDNLLEMGRINCGASLLKIGTDEWNLIGELV